MSVARPRKKAAITTYGDLYKTKIKETFDPLWESQKSSVASSERIRKWMDHVRTCWEKETPEIRDDVINQTDEENEESMEDWKKKTLRTGSSEDLNR